MSLDEGLQRAEAIAKEIEQTEGYDELIAKQVEAEIERARREAEQ